MKLSERSIKRVAEIITGDKGRSPYRSGPSLVSFFNDFGCDHTYGQGFPSRWMFAEERIRKFNGTATLKKIILSALAPRDFMGITVIDKQTQQSKPLNLQDARSTHFVSAGVAVAGPSPTISMIASPSLLPS